MLSFVSSLLPTSASAAAGINPQINFQGRLLNAAGAVVPDGAYNLEFKLYTGGTGCVAGGTTPCGGTNVWTEDWVYGSGAPDNRVIVRNGYFSVSLGALTSLTGVDFNNDTLWTSINIGNTTTAATFAAASGDGEMLPFKRLTSSPYAFNAGKLGGLAATSFLQLAQGVQTDASTANASLFVNKTGITASILDLQRGGADVLLVNNSGQALFRPTVNSATALQVQQAGTSTTIFTVDSTNARIGIGTGAPAYAVDAVGSVNASVSLKVAGVDVCTSTGCTAGSGSGSYIQNGVGLQSSANFNISGTGTLATSVITPLLDTASAVALNVGTTASVINLNKNVVVVAGQYLNLVGGGTRPGSPTDGMLFYDTTAHTLLQYNSNTAKWQADRSTSTKIVGTSATGGTSGAVASQSPDGADFVNASTTSAQTVINAAIAALPATGGNVYFMEGTYIVDGAITVPANVSISGAGPATIFKVKNATNGNFSVFSLASLGIIQNIAIDGNKANQTSGGMFGITTSGNVANVSVANMYGGTGINSSGNNTSITSNTVTGGTYAWAIKSNGQGNIISGNTITGNTAARGIQFDFANNLISGNTISGNLAGIWTTNGYNSTITGNTINSNPSGIEFDSGGTNTKNITISGNIITGSTNYGIYLNDIGSTGNPSNVTISNNIITGGGTGIRINVWAIASPNTLSNNNVSGNTTAINDNGIGTIYANQSDGNDNLINKSQGGGLTVGASSANSSLTLQGGLKSTALPVPVLSATVTNVGTAGATTHRYQITALDGLGETTGSTIQQTTTGNATLSGTNYNTITWGDVGGAYQYRIYRCTGAACTPLLLTTMAGNTNSYNDQAAGAPSGAVPTVNTTGGASLAALLQGTTATFTGTSSLTVGAASTAAGSIAFNNATNANTVTIVSGVTSTTYQLTLPTALSGGAGDCLKDTTGAGVLAFSACGAASGNLQGSYNASGGATPSIAVNTTNKAVTIQNSITSGIAAGNEYFGIRATGASDVVLGNSLFTVNSTGVGINIGGTGNPATTADLSFGSGANRTINVITQTAGNTAGNNLGLTAATGNGTGAGGALALNGGTGGSGATGNGGATTVTGGNAASTNGSGGSVTISGGTKTGSGTGGSVIIKPQTSNDSTTAFQAQNAAGNGILTVDTTGSQTVLGKAGAGGIDGKLVFNNAAGANTVTLQAPGSNPASSFALILPTTAGNANECIKNTATPGTLTYGTCGGAVTMQGAYDGSTTTNPQILLSSTNGGIKIQDGATPVTGNLLQIGPNGSTTTAYLGISATAFTLQDTAGNNALVFDSTTSHLKVYENIASPTRFADIYYDNATNSAIFAASSGITQVGTGAGGGGNINLVLTGTADQLLTSKTNTLAAAYGLNDFKFTRNLTGGAYAVTGNVMTVEDLTTFSGGSSAPNVLYVNQNNTSATGNLILAQTGGGANDKFKVNTAGTVTIAVGQSYTGSGALTLQSGAGTALTVTANAASTWSTSAGALTLSSASASTWSTSTGNLTIQAGGANTVILKPGTDSATALQVQNASGASMLDFDSSANQISIGVSDTTGTLLVLDTKTDAADPTGVNGGMYYNSNAGRFRCYENGAWADCLGYRHLITLGSDSTSTAAGLNVCQTVTGASFAVTSGVTYRFHATILHTASAATIGVSYGASGPATPTLFAMSFASTITTPAIAGGGQSVLNTCTGPTASSLATAGAIDTVDGIFIPSADGTFQLKFAPETNTAGGTVIKAGSTLEWW